MFNAGAMPYLIQGMKSDIDGMRAACAQTARNIYVLGTLGNRISLHQYNSQEIAAVLLSVLCVSYLTADTQ